MEKDGGKKASRSGSIAAHDGKPSAAEAAPAESTGTEGGGARRKVNRKGRETQQKQRSQTLAKLFAGPRRGTGRDGAAAALAPTATARQDGAVAACEDPREKTETQNSPSVTKEMQKEEPRKMGQGKQTLTSK